MKPETTPIKSLAVIADTRDTTNATAQPCVSIGRPTKTTTELQAEQSKESMEQTSLATGRSQTGMPA